MRTSAALLAAALLVTACGQKKLTAEDVRAAMPNSAALRIDAPAAAATGAAPAEESGGPQLSVAAAAAGPAPLGVSSYLLATAVNGGVFWALAPIAWLTEVVPPTSCTDTACTWGPGSSDSDLNTWMLVVTKAGDGYDYTLSGAPRAPAGSAFVPVLSGKAFPGSTRHRGHGTFHVDFDASFAGLAHVSGATQQDFGSIVVDYDATSALVLDVTFLGSRNSDHPGADAAHPNRTNAVYAFRASDTGGDLKVGWRTLAPFTVEAPRASFSLHTQWQASGAGVADARFGAPDLAAGSTIVTFSECWAGPPTYAMSYDSLSTTLVDKAACAIAPGAPVDIAIP